MKTQGMQIIFMISLILALNGGSAAQEPENMQMKIDSPLRSDVFAALLVAYNEHSRWWKNQGVDLTPGEFRARHWAIHYSKISPDRLRVVFLPEPPTGAGGDVGYVVDLKSLQVVERFFGR